MKPTTALLLLSALFLLVTSLAQSGQSEKCGMVPSMKKVSASIASRPFLINRVFNYYSNDGTGSYNKFSPSGEGFELPIGYARTMVFEDGVMWAGVHDGKVKAGGFFYKSGLQPGWIVSSGVKDSLPVPADPNDSRHRIYRVRPDINPGTPFDANMSSKIETEECYYIRRFEAYSAHDIYDQYIADWNQWPAIEGAPFTDVDKNGIYDPAVDIPGQPGADQTLWYVANDALPSLTRWFTGCAPIGLEMQRTVWGYDRTGLLGNTVFLATRIVNRSGIPVDSMYFCQWSDVDLGSSIDDVAGCDTTRDLGYVYNSPRPDPVYAPLSPACGYVLLQGPLVPAGFTDAGRAGLKERAGFKNLPMTAFSVFTCGGPYSPPEYESDSSAAQWMNVMKGRLAGTGLPYLDNLGRETRFTFSGDVVHATGWRDGDDLSCGDRIIALSSGPFHLAPDEAQEIVVASVGAMKADRLESIALLLNDADTLRTVFADLHKTPLVPGERPVHDTTAAPSLDTPHPKYAVSESYPNPVTARAPWAFIKYTLPDRASVTVRIYNVLGQLVRTVVSTIQSAGTRTVRWDGQNDAGLRVNSGVYFYKVDMSGLLGESPRTTVGKMIVLH